MKNLNILFITLISMQISFAQSNLLNAENPEDIGVKTPAQLDKDDESYLDYGHVDDKDVLFSKTVWEIIDLNERVNFPLLYPTDTLLVGLERRPLIHYLIKAIQSGEIPKIYSDGKFNIPKSMSLFEQSLADTILTPDGEDKIFFYGTKQKFLQSKGVDLGELDLSQTDLDNLLPEQYSLWESKIESMCYSLMENGSDYIINNFQYDQVEQYLIKGVWYFDKIQGDLRYRPLALSPITTSVKDRQKNDFLRPGDKPKVSELFWIYYPHARESLKNAYVFSAKNSAVRKSFDELINARRFNSVIFLEENVQEDREIKDYITKNSFMQLLESERIKEKIRNLEHDMWSW
jgi:gliding motility associated protien GldN